MTIVRVRADSRGRKGAIKRPASSPPPLTPTREQGKKVMGFLEVNDTEIYVILISLFVSYSITDNGPK